MRLQELFEMQATLNDRVGLDGDKFAVDFADGEGSEENLMEAGRWIDDMLKAMASEMEELRRCTFWKHWCSEAQEGRRYMVHNLEGARKEVIDMLHFWVSLAQIVGMTPAMVENMYVEKLAKNLKRQDDGYSVTLKAKAWELFGRHNLSCQCLQPGDIGAKSFEDLDEKTQQLFLSMARALS